MEQCAIEGLRVTHRGTDPGIFHEKCRAVLQVRGCEGTMANTAWKHSAKENEDNLRVMTSDSESERGQDAYCTVHICVACSQFAW